jgi:hypothetical protein
MGLMAKSAREAWHAFLTEGIDDAFVLIGVLLIGVGLYRLAPMLIWFYAGGVCVVIGIAIPRVRLRQRGP